MFLVILRNFLSLILNFPDDDHSIAELNQAADMFVLTSIEDNLPNTVIESMACGTPLVAFNIGGLQEMVDHKITGYLLKLKVTMIWLPGLNGSVPAWK